MTRRLWFSVLCISVCALFGVAATPGMAQDAVDPADAILSGDAPAEDAADEPANEPAEAPPAAPPAQEPPAAAATTDTAPQEPAPEPAPAPATETAADPADTVADPADTVTAPPASPAATAPASGTAPAAAAESGTRPTGDPAALASDPAESVGAAAGGGDIADEVLASQETAPTQATQEAYVELRKTIEASVQISELESTDRMVDGILIRRGNKGTKGAPARLGFTGVFRTISADLPPVRSFRFGSHFSFYHMPELWDDTSQSHMDAIGFFSYSVRDDLELRLAGVASGHHSGTISRVGQDALFQTLGDVYMGGKYAYEVLPFLHLAGIADLRFFTQVGSFLLRPDATSLSIIAAATLDLYRARWFPKLTIPVRVHANLGYTLDRSSNVLSDVETQNASTFGGFGLSPGDGLPFLLAGEVIMEPFSYFLEYQAEPILNNRADNAIPTRPKLSQSTQRFTLGARWNAVENILLDAAIDLSFGLNQAVSLYGSAERPGPPYQLHFGITYEWNPEGYEVIDMRGQIVGIVVDAQTGQPVGGAVLEYLDSEDYSAQAADTQSGAFETYKIPPGEVLIRISHEGYEPVIINPEITGPQVLEEKIFLRRPDQAESRSGALAGTVLDQDGSPVTAEIRFLGVDIDAVRTDPADGSFVKILPEGTYQVEVAAEGYGTKVYEVPVEAQKKTTVGFQLISGADLGALAGAVADQEGRPLQATVVFLDAQVDALQTGAQGEFDKVLPPGKYAIEVKARGYVPKRYRVPVERGKKTKVDVQLEKESAVGMLAGRILTPGGQPLAGMVNFAADDVAPVPADPDTGSFEVMLPAGTYEIGIEAEDHETKRYRIPVLAGKKTVQDFRLEPTARSQDLLAQVEGDRIATEEPVEFEFGGTDLREDAFPVLDAVGTVMLGLPSGASVRIESHTHNLGPAEANRKLSADRAEAIVQYLISIGMPRTRMTPVGLGESDPAIPYESEEAQQMGAEAVREANERIVFEIVQ